MELPTVDYTPLFNALRLQREQRRTAQSFAIGAVTGLANFFIEQDKQTSLALAKNRLQAFDQDAKAQARKALLTGSVNVDAATGDVTMPEDFESWYAAERDALAKDPHISRYSEVKSWAQDQSYNVYSAVKEEALAVAVKDSMAVGTVAYQRQVSDGVDRAIRSGGDLSALDAVGKGRPGWISAERWAADRKAAEAAVTYGLAQETTKTAVATKGYAAGIVAIEAMSLPEEQKKALRDLATEAEKTVGYAYEQAAMQKYVANVDAGQPDDSALNNAMTGVPDYWKASVAPALNQRAAQYRAETSRVADEELAKVYSEKGADAARKALYESKDAKGRSFGDRLDVNSELRWANVLSTQPTGSDGLQMELSMQAQLNEWVRNGKQGPAPFSDQTIIDNALTLGSTGSRQLQNDLAKALEADPDPQDVAAGTVGTAMYHGIENGIDPYISVRDGVIEQGQTDGKYGPDHAEELRALRYRLHQDFVANSKGKTTWEGERDAYEIVYNDSTDPTTKKNKIDALVEANRLSGSDAAVWVGRIDVYNGNDTRKAIFDDVDAYFRSNLATTTNEQAKQRIASDRAKARDYFDQYMRDNPDDPLKWQQARQDYLDNLKAKDVLTATYDVLSGYAGVAPTFVSGFPKNTGAAARPWTDTALQEAARERDGALPPKLQEALAANQAKLVDADAEVFLNVGIPITKASPSVVLTSGEFAGERLYSKTPIPVTNGIIRPTADSYIVRYDDTPGKPGVLTPRVYRIAKIEVAAGETGAQRSSDGKWYKETFVPFATWR